jgi:SAM-dependent methyltransferase
MAAQTAQSRPPQPASRLFGFDRGTPIDRYYIEAFLEANAHAIRGRVLEVGDASYTRLFGGKRVSQSDVLHATAGNSKATLVGDLASGDGIPVDAFDCIILTQVLPFIYDVSGAIATCYRALRPRGVVLATVAGISQISRYDMDRWGDFWRFTDLSARRLFEHRFASAGSRVDVHTAGNITVATGFLQGLALEELSASDMEFNDPDYQLIISIRAQKGSHS